MGDRQDPTRNEIRSDSAGSKSIHSIPTESSSFPDWVECGVQYVTAEDNTTTRRKYVTEEEEKATGDALERGTIVR